MRYTKYKSKKLGKQIPKLDGIKEWEQVLLLELENEKENFIYFNNNMCTTNVSTTLTYIRVSAKQKFLDGQLIEVHKLMKQSWLIPKKKVQ